VIKLAIMKKSAFFCLLEHIEVLQKGGVRKEGKAQLRILGSARDTSRRRYLPDRERKPPYWFLWERGGSVKKPEGVSRGECK